MAPLPLIPPRSLKNSFDKQPLAPAKTRILWDKDAYYAAILEEINETLRRDRACFVVLKQTENVNVLEEYLANLDSDKTVPQYTTPEMLKDTTKKLDKVAIIARATAQYINYSDDPFVWPWN